MLEARTFAILSVSFGDEHTHDRNDDLVQITGRNQDSEVARERLVPRCTAKGQSEEHFVPDLDRFCADVVCVLNCTDETAAVESDVEFSRQVIKSPVVNDDMGEFRRAGVTSNSSQGQCRLSDLPSGCGYCPRRLRGCSPTS